MNITSSLVFIPKDAIYVKKSLSTDILDNLTPQNPLLRDFNSKNNKKPKQQEPQQYKQPRHENNIQEKPQESYKPERTNGEKKFIINKTGNPIYLSFSERDDKGNSITVNKRITSHINKNKFSLSQLDSQEVRVLYDEGFVFDGNEEDIPKKQTKTKELTNKQYKSSEGDLYHEYEVNGKTQKILVTEDISNSQRSVLVDDSDIPEPSRGMSQMYEGMDDDGDISDLIPNRRPSMGGGGKQIERL